MADRVEVIIDLKEPLNAICVEKTTESWSVRITWVLITGGEDLLMSKDVQIVPGNIKGVVKYYINVESAMEVYIMIIYVQQHNLQYRNNPF